MKLLCSIIFVCFVYLLAGCVEESALPPAFKAARSRTILFYMAADNGLSADSEQKIEALAAAWNIPGDNHLLVYQDRGGENKPRLLEIVTEAMGTVEVRVLEEYEPENSASTYPFIRAMNAMRTRYPGGDYGLIVFSHGSGWLPQGTFTPPTRSVATDGWFELELTDFAAAIPDNQFRFIVFESCLMAGVEVAYELKDKTPYILASTTELLAPGFTPLYGQMLHELYAEEPRLENFGKAYYTYCEGLEGDFRSAALSVIRTSELASFKPLLKQVESHVAHWGTLDRTSWQHFDRKTDRFQFYDLADYVRAVGTEEEVAQLDTLLSKAIVWQASTDSFIPSSKNGFRIERHCGLSVYVPIPEFEYLNKKRKALQLFTDKK